MSWDNLPLLETRRQLEKLGREETPVPLKAIRNFSELQTNRGQKQGKPRGQRNLLLSDFLVFIETIIRENK